MAPSTQIGRFWVLFKEVFVCLFQEVAQANMNCSNSQETEKNISEISIS